MTTIPMLHTPADVALQALIDLGVVGSDPDDETGWPGFVDIMPDWPDQVVLLRDTQGRQHGTSMIDGDVARTYGAQVTVRSQLSENGAVKAFSLQDTMSRGVYGMNVTLGGSTYKLHCFTEVGDVIPVGLEDGSNRFVHTINVMIAVRRLT